MVNFFVGSHEAVSHRNCVQRSALRWSSPVNYPNKRWLQYCS